METCVYGAYGDRVAGTVDVPRTAYAGYVREGDLPWYVLGQRIYIPWLRRFIGVDALSPFGAGGLNRYTYCVGDPINQIDPSGHASWKWLGNLLGKIGGAMGKGMDMVSQVTPTTALTRIGAVADVVAVGTTIGAVAAGALGDESTAGILGWVAAGSGLGGIGLGVAGQYMQKGSRPSTDSHRRSIEAATNSRGGRPLYAPDSQTGYAKVNLDDSGLSSNGQPFYVYAESFTYHPAEWHTAFHPKNSGSLNVFADSVIFEGQESAPIRTALGNLNSTTPTTVYLYGGSHGKRDGYNRNYYNKWMGGELNGYFDDLKADEVNRISKYLPAGSKIEYLPIRDMTPESVRNKMRNTGVHIHFYCWSGADRVLLDELNISAPALAPATVDLPGGPFFRYGI